MKDLSAATGIGSDANYLNGNLVDAQTFVNAHINQDMVQFFQKLMSLASLTANGNFDNETNDYQTIEALLFSTGQRTYKTKSSATAGNWYTIAKIDGTVKAGSARFVIWQKNTSTGKYQSIHLYCGHTLGKVDYIKILGSIAYTIPNVIEKIRIKSDGATDGAMLQIYINTATDIHVAMYENEISDGWELIEPTTTEPISSLNETELIYCDSLKNTLRTTLLQSSSKILCELLPVGELTRYGVYNVDINEKNSGSQINGVCKFTVAVDGDDMTTDGVPTLKVINDVSKSDFINNVKLRQWNTEVTSVANVSGDVWRYTFTSSQDVTDLAAGDDIIFLGFTGGDTGNNGKFKIDTITSTYVDVENTSGSPTTNNATALHKLYLVIENTDTNDKDIDITIKPQAKSAFRFITQDGENLSAVVDGTNSNEILLANYELNTDAVVNTGAGAWTATINCIKLPGNIVCIKGSAESDTGVAIDDLIATIPAKYRPSASFYFTGIDSSDNGTKYGLVIKTNGQLETFDTVPNTGAYFYFTVFYPIT